MIVVAVMKVDQGDRYDRSGRFECIFMVAVMVVAIMNVMAIVIWTPRSSQGVLCSNTFS